MASAPLGSAFTMATFCAIVRLREPMFQASVAGPPLATIWSRQLWSLIVDSRAAEPPSRTTTGLVGVSACMQASAARTRLQSAPEAPLAPAPLPSASSSPAPSVAAAPVASEADPAVALAEHAAAAAAASRSATTSAMVTLTRRWLRAIDPSRGPALTLAWKTREARPREAPPARRVAVRAARGGCRVARQSRASPGGLCP